MRKTFAGTGSYDIIVPKFKKLVEKRDPALDYYARGTFTARTWTLRRMLYTLRTRALTACRSSRSLAEDGCGYELTEADLDKIYAEYDRLTDIMEERRKNGKPFLFFHSWWTCSRTVRSQAPARLRRGL